MEICRISPNAPDYSADLFFKGKSATLSGGTMKLVAAVSSMSALANVTWKVNSCDMNYLMMFYLVCKTSAFQIDLITTAGVVTKVCRFIPETFKANLSNTIWTITATLEVLDG